MDTVAQAPATRMLTTKYSPLPLNYRMMLRSALYPGWNFTSKDFKKSEKEVANDLADLAKMRIESRDTHPNYSRERDVILNPNKYQLNKEYVIPEWNNQKVTGQQLVDAAKDLMSNGIAFHDYESLGEMGSYDKYGNIIPKYSQNKIQKALNFNKDKWYQQMYNSFTNPVYAVRTGLGRAELNSKYNPTELRDTFDFAPINKANFERSKDYTNLHKFAEAFASPMKVNLELGR